MCGMGNAFFIMNIIWSTVSFPDDDRHFLQDKKITGKVSIMCPLCLYHGWSSGADSTRVHGVTSWFNDP